MLAAGPERFGRYVLLHRIGVGGMAEVFHARSQGSRGVGKDLVIKRIQPEHSADPEFVEMFVDEARVALRLQHPCVVQAFDFGEIDGRCFMAMERVDGLSVIQLVRQRVRQGRLLPVGVALYIAHCVATGLEYIHALRDDADRPLSLVHRDICPANVLLSRRGDVKIADFGIARSALNTFTTQGPVPKGHVAYMSPEQARGEAVGPASDLFSLGIMLHELLTGRRLFKHPSSAGSLRRILTADIAPPSTLNAEISEAVDAVVMGLLRRDLAERTPGAADLVVALAALLPAEPDQLRRELAGMVRDSQPLAIIGATASVTASSPTMLREETTELSARPVGWWWLIGATGLLLCVAVGVSLLALQRGGAADHLIAVAPEAPVALAEDGPAEAVLAEAVLAEAVLAEAVLAEPMPEARAEPVVSALAASPPPERVLPEAPPPVVPEPIADAEPVADAEPLPAVSPQAASPQVDPSAPATVRIVLEGGWGFITVDGRALRRKKGQDPSISLAPGMHTLQVRRSSDSRVLSRQIEVLAGQDQTIVFDLRL